MKKILMITGVLTAALIVASFAGCGEKEKLEVQDVSSLKQEQEVSADQNAPQDQNALPAQRGTMAKVAALNGDQLTVVHTLSGSVTVMKGPGGSATEIDLSELKADDVISFTTEEDDTGNEVIGTITIMK